MQQKSFFNPPRILSRRLILGIHYGGLFAFVGWAMLAFAFIFVHITAFDTDFGDSLKLDNPQVVNVEGAVIEIEDTGIYIETNNIGEMVIGIHFRYQVDGQELKGVSYFNLGYGMPNPYKVGDALDILYKEGDLTYAKINEAGMRTKKIGAWWIIFIPLIFVSISLGFIIYEYKKAKRYILVLSDGIATTGVYSHKKGTSMQVNKRPVYEYFFKFNHQDKEHEVKVRTHEPSRILDEEREKILFLPAKPEVNILIDQLPIKPELDQARGVWSARLGVRTYFTILFSGITLFLHLPYFFWRMLF